MEKAGMTNANDFFMGDHTHTSYSGALMNAQSIVTGLKKSDSQLKKYLGNNNKGKAK